ncbi:flagellar assembly protein FliH [Alsobacter metallidurans]|uniref:Flagellar assembly protein FliH n=1 Tax=Alsobacter metallidurans TaxID=340221 RepID=A0A917IBA2_9HYPH|nr:FliH/SctL family protein [Alsobacter metallidurans]GGH28948.1 flagellar assembly protein FliH [Alsobacter metallidurans]
MSNAQKFSFDNDFGSDRRSQSMRRQADVERLQQAEQEGWERGRMEGRREAEQEAAMRMALAIEQVAGAAAAVIAHLEHQTERLELEAAELAIVFARKLAGDLLAREPLGPLEAAAQECFREMAGAPHLAVRVPPECVDSAKEVLERKAIERGFAGRLVVLGEDGMAQGDFVIEWADGGMRRDSDALQRNISGAIQRHLGAGFHQS